MLAIALLSCWGSARTNKRSGASMSTRSEAPPRLDEATASRVISTRSACRRFTISAPVDKRRRGSMSSESCPSSSVVRRRSSRPSSPLVLSVDQLERRPSTQEWAPQLVGRPGDAELTRSITRSSGAAELMRGNTAPEERGDPFREVARARPAHPRAGGRQDPPEGLPPRDYPVTCRNRARIEGSRSRRDPGPSGVVWSEARSSARRRAPTPSDAAVNHPQPSRSGSRPATGTFRWS